MCTRMQAATTVWSSVSGQSTTPDHWARDTLNMKTVYVLIKKKSLVFVTQQPRLDPRIIAAIHIYPKLASGLSEQEENKCSESHFSSNPE